MTVHVNLGIDLPAFREALTETRERCVVEQLTRPESDAIRCAIRAPPPLASALRDDPSVRGTAVVDDVGPWRTLQLVVKPEQLTYDELAECAAILDRIEATAEGWYLDCRFPDEQRLQEYHRECRQRDFRIRLHSLSTGNAGGQAALTSAQWEVLDAARRRGYYEVPRSVSLNELAADLDLSTQAASERLRRGVGTLLDRQLPTAPQATGDPSPEWPSTPRN